MMTFDRNFARLLLEICRYTYAASFTSAPNRKAARDALGWINKTAKPARIVKLDDGEQPSTSVAFVVAYPDKNIVSYMGTKTEFDDLRDSVASIADWVENFKAVPVPFKLTAEQLGQDHPDKDDLGGLVHDGFLQQLAAVQAKVVATLNRNGGTSRPLYVTGHSQGGAEAALATRAFLAGGFPVAATYTFAAPRPGDRDFAASIPATLQMHRLEFGNDIVPHVPPRAISQEIDGVIKGLRRIPILPAPAKKVLAGLSKKGIDFVGAGKLCYGSNESRTLRVDMDADQEAGLFNHRLLDLAMHPEDWAEHHHLAGTTKEIKAGKRGNYTALVSEFPMVS